MTREKKRTLTTMALAASGAALGVGVAYLMRTAGAT
jgi:hypothetical protein